MYILAFNNCCCHSNSSSIAAFLPPQVVYFLHSMIGCKVNIDLANPLLSARRPYLHREEAMNPPVHTIPHSQFLVSDLHQKLIFRQPSYLIHCPKIGDEVNMGLKNPILSARNPKMHWDEGVTPPVVTITQLAIFGVRLQFLTILP